MKEVFGKKLYSVNETAELLGVSCMSVHNYAKQKKLRITPIGGRKFFSEESLRDFLQEQQ